MTHSIEQCKHKVLYSQCRCPSPNKTVRTVPCEWVDCLKDDEISEQQVLQEVAELIILDHAKDIEYSSVVEMSWDNLDLGDYGPEERDEILTKIDKLISKAKVTVTFE